MTPREALQLLEEEEQRVRADKTLTPTQRANRVEAILDARNAWRPQLAGRRAE